VIQAKEKPSRIIGIDFGLKRIGLAQSDERHILASQLETFRADGKLEETAAELARQLKQRAEREGFSIHSIVIGLPLRMSGEVGLMADETKVFADALKGLIDVPVVLWDERLTSVQAERSMMEGRVRRKKRAQKVDGVAAVLILQSYLDSLSEPSDLPPIPPLP